MSCSPSARPCWAWRRLLGDPSLRASASALAGNRGGVPVGVDAVAGEHDKVFLRRDGAWCGRLKACMIACTASAPGRVARTARAGRRWRPKRNASSAGWRRGRPAPATTGRPSSSSGRSGTAGPHRRWPPTGDRPRRHAAARGAPDRLPLPRASARAARWPGPRARARPGSRP